jgi:hypothetical protein
MRTLWSTIVLSIWGTQCSLGREVGATGAQQCWPNEISQKSRVPLQAVVPCLTWICRNQSPICKYFEIQFFAQQPIRTQREFSQAPADGTQLELTFYQLFSSDCDVLHFNYKERLKLLILYPSSTSNCVSLFSLTRSLYGIFSLFAPIGQILSFPSRSAGAGFLLSSTWGLFLSPTASLSSA